MLTRRAGKWSLSSKLSDVVKRFGLVAGVFFAHATADSATPNNRQERARYEARLRPVSSVEGETVAGRVL